MGIFGSGSSSSSSSSSTNVSPEQQPSTRSTRQECWNGRDAYFRCLSDKKIIVPPGTDMNDGRTPGSKASTEDKQKAKEKEAKLAQDREHDPCKAQRSTYERTCAQSWIDYFNKRRVLEERQRLMYESGKAPIGSGPAPGNTR